MTHFKTFFLSCFLALAAFPATAEEADFTVDGLGYAITSTSDLTVKVVVGPDQAVVTIPSSVVFNNKTFHVTGISNDAFQNHTELRSVDMPSITWIENGIKYSIYYKGAFSGCTHLIHVNMPAVEKIGDGTFSECDSLTSISLPAATTIGNSAFGGCGALTSVSLPAATTIGHFAFSGCDALASVSLPTATSIGYKAFQNCKTLTSVSLPVATFIGDDAFRDCDALASVSLPAATSIGDRAFYDCKALASISLPAATTIGKYAFDSCNALTSVSLPAATSIGNGAFYLCPALASISLPVATSIGDYAFYDCKALASVSMPAATSIGDWAFDDCDALTSISLPVATSIGYDAFRDCDALTSVSLPVATSIGDYALLYCDALCDIYVGDQPAQCFDETFSKITYATATLHVPAGCASKYKAAEPWKNFAFISEDYDPTGIKSTKVNDVKIYTDNGSVQLTGLKEGEKVVFYSLGGKLIGAQKANSGTISITTSEPVVICKMGGKSIKILVK